MKKIISIILLGVFSLSANAFDDTYVKGYLGKRFIVQYRGLGGLAFSTFPYLRKSTTLGGDNYYPAFGWGQEFSAHYTLTTGATFGLHYAMGKVPTTIRNVSSNGQELYFGENHVLNDYTSIGGTLRIYWGQMVAPIGRYFVLGLSKINIQGNETDSLIATNGLTPGPGYYQETVSFKDLQSNGWNYYAGVGFQKMLNKWFGYNLEFSVSGNKWKNKSDYRQRAMNESFMLQNRFVLKGGINIHF